MAILNTISNNKENIVITSTNPYVILSYTYNESIGDGATIFPFVDYESVDTNLLSKIKKAKITVNGQLLETMPTLADVKNVVRTNDPLIQKYLLNNTNKSVQIIFTVHNNVDNIDLLQSIINGVNIGFQLKVYVKETDEIESFSIYIRPTFISNITLNENQNVLLSQNSSKLMLRTNPKLTGNIKIVVDSKDNIFLDTFGVSEFLQKSEYRKYPVSGNGVLSFDIYSAFNSVPQGELYKIGTNTTDIKYPLIYDNLYQQYNDVYCYGAKTLSDNLYPENYSILAPLWIEDKIPDYFVIFSLDETFNPESYNESINDLFLKYLKNGKIVKVFNLKKDKPFGQYLYQHLQEIKKLENPVKLALNNQDNDTWYGIAVDKGILTGRENVSYLFDRVVSPINQTDEESIDYYNNCTVYSAVNEYVTNGYERNNLLCANLLNIEYLFDDIDANNYQMKKYYGLYLTDNVLFEFLPFVRNNEFIDYFYKGNKEDYDNFTDLIIDGESINEDYSNRIIFLEEGDSIKRISNKNDLSIDTSSYNIIPGDNIFNISADEVPNTYRYYLNIKLNDKLLSGEHFRIIKPESSVEHINESVYDIYITSNYIFDGSNYITYVEKDNVIYYRIYCFIDNEDDLDEQCKKLSDKFKTYSDVFSVFDVINFDTDINILSNNPNLKFQYISNNLYKNNPVEPSNKVSFFTDNLSNISFEGNPVINFEYYGNREYYQLDFVDILGGNYLYEIRKSDVSFIIGLDDGKTESKSSYYSTDGNYYLFDKFDIYNYESININNKNTFYSIQSPFSSESVIIKTQFPIDLDSGVLHGHEAITKKISLLGINDVCDFDYVVYDNKSIINGHQMDFSSDNTGISESFTFEKIISGGTTLEIPNQNFYYILKGKGNIRVVSDESSSTPTIQSYNNDIEGNPLWVNGINTYAITGNKVYIDAETDTVLSTFGKYLSNTNNTSNENIEDDNIINYINVEEQKLSNNSVYQIVSYKYNLVTPSINKWEMPYYNTKHKNISLNFNLKSLNTEDNGYTNNLPINGNIDTMGYPIYKYLDNDGTYLYYDITDVIKNINKTVRNAIFDYPTIDIIFKYITSSSADSNNAQKVATLVYDNPTGNLDTIVGGTKISFAPSDNYKQYVNNIRKYDGYKVNLVISTSPSMSHKNCEIIINENTSSVLIIIYSPYNNGNIELQKQKYNINNNFLNDVNLPNVNSPIFSTLLDASVGNSKYSYAKSMFRLKTDTDNKEVEYLYNYNQSNIEQLYVMGLRNPYLQYNYENNGTIYCSTNSNWSIENNNSFVDNNICYQNLENDVSIVYNYYTPNAATFDDKSINRGYLCNTNMNLYSLPIDRYGNEYSLYKNIESILADNITYIVRDDKVISIYNNQPLFNFSVVNPIEYSTLTEVYNGNSKEIVKYYLYNGIYKPTMYNILNFSYNETNEILGSTKADFALCNTNYISSNGIKQYWYNLVVGNNKTITNTDVSIGYYGCIDYHKEFETCLSMWDKDYFSVSDGRYFGYRNNNLGNTNGYLNTTEIKSFFGSKGIKLPYKFVIDNWSNDTLTIEGDIKLYDDSNKTTNVYMVQCNITDSIINIVSGNSVYLSNWENLEIDLEDNTDIIEEYVQKNIVPYYDINRLTVKVYYKSYDGELVHKTSDGFILSPEYEYKNINSYLTKDNDNKYFYNIKFNDITNYSFYIQIEILK